MKQIVVFLWASLIVCTCSGRQKPISIETDDAGKWSVKMADAVMTRFDTLAFYNHRKKAGWSYDVAMLGMAIHKLGDINPKYAAYMKTYMDMLVDDAGNIPAYNRLSYNIDFINPARNLILLFRQTGEEKYRKALPQFIRQMEEHPKTKTGGYWHKKRYPWQIWLDGVYMGMPFLTMYARDFDQPQWFDIAAHEIKLVYEKTIDTETGLLYHAWDESREQRWA
ncbi:MAG TPA: glycoside hydrolase family 88 protein, partial [Prolixibacteraceae bacterium]|nr:glycoside hydrolase family 88 protein [Prolixibacteraceae bacterium]